MKIRSKQPTGHVARTADGIAETYSTLKSEIAEKTQQLKDAGWQATQLAKTAGSRVGKRVVVRTPTWEVGFLEKTKTTLDEDALRKKIGERKWEKITLLTRVVDAQLLKKALSRGLISIQTYKSCLTTTEAGTAPYIRKAKKSHESDKED